MLKQRSNLKVRVFVDDIATLILEGQIIFLFERRPTGFCSPKAFNLRGTALSKPLHGNIYLV